MQTWKVMTPWHAGDVSAATEEEALVLARAAHPFVPRLRVEQTSLRLTAGPPATPFDKQRSREYDQMLRRRRQQRALTALLERRQS